MFGIFMQLNKYTFLLLSLLNTFFQNKLPKTDFMIPSFVTLDKLVNFSESKVPNV